MKLIKKIFLFISLIYFSISYDTQYFTCENKIYCDNSYLSFNDLNNLCSTLLSNNRYIIFVSNKLIYPDDNSYTVLSENFFKNYCVNTAYGCKNSFGIFIYIQSGKILIVAGQNVKAYVSKQNRLNVIQTIIPYLQNNNYYTGLEVGIQNLEKILRLNSNESDGGMSFFWIILIILGLGLCLYCVFKSSEKIINQENEMYNNNEINNDLNAQLYESNNNNYIVSNVNNNSLEIHQFPKFKLRPKNFPIVNRNKIFRKFNHQNQNRLELKRRKKIPRKILEFIRRKFGRIYQRQKFNRIQQNKHQKPNFQSTNRKNRSKIQIPKISHNSQKKRNQRFKRTLPKLRHNQIQ